MPVVEAFLGSVLGSVDSIEPVSGGLVHHVFRVKSGDNEYYLKVRGNRFAGIPTIESLPEDIRFEARALQIMSGTLPNIFPHLVSENREVGALLITSIMQPQHNLPHKLRKKEITSREAEIIGRSLRKIHEKLSRGEHYIREDGDEDYYQKNLLYRLGSQENVILQQTIKELSQRKRSLIHGDLSPKNLGLVSDELRICDLDTVHRGNPIFDVGFFIAHIFLHSLELGYPPARYTDSFLDAYQYEMETPGIPAEDHDLLMRIVLGILLYRLNNKIVPYALDISDTERKGVVDVVRSLLEVRGRDWKDVGSKILYAKSH